MSSVHELSNLHASVTTLIASVLPFKCAFNKYEGAHKRKRQRRTGIVVVQAHSLIFDWLLLKVEKTYRSSYGLQGLDRKILFVAWGVSFTAVGSLKEEHRHSTHRDKFHRLFTYKTNAHGNYKLLQIHPSGFSTSDIMILCLYTG